MCGVFSIVSHNEPVEEATLDRAVRALDHRGPDGRGFWIGPSRRIGLGHARLAIIDLQTGSQPIASEDGQIHLVANGEFYGHREIRRDLEHRGHRFRSQSDSEIAVHLYEVHGVSFVSHLRGEFAFILWDQRRHQLLAVRDRFGIKPLCYAVLGKSILISSEAKAIFAAGFAPAWDHAAFFHAACLQYVPTDRTLFQNIRQIPPGHYLSLRDGQIQIVRYWDMNYPTVDTAADETAAREELSARLEECLRLRLDADVPVCFHLSGGLDSSGVVGIASKLCPQPLHCFSVGFEAEGYNELSAAREMARHAGAHLHELPLKQTDLLSALPDAVFAAEGLAINGHLPAKFLLSRAIRDAGFKVVLSGEGADELMAGYPHLRQDLFESRGASPESIARLHSDNAMMAGIQLPQGDTLPLLAIQQSLGFVPTFLRAKATYGHRMQRVLSNDFLVAMGQHDCYQEMLERFDIPAQLHGRHRVNQATYLWSKLALANYILRTLGDGTEMAHSVEGRLPFLDHTLFEFTRGLPMELKINGTVEKYLLREVLRPVITNAVYRRPKQPFTAPPLYDLSANGAGRLFRDMLSSQSFASLAFFDRNKIQSLLDAAATMSPQQRVAMDPIFMMILSASLLHMRYRMSSN